jgi:hypothetical protein
LPPFDELFLDPFSEPFSELLSELLAELLSDAFSDLADLSDLPDFFDPPPILALKLPIPLPS